MILSVSRRTDIPNYYSEWFFRRLKEGFLYVRNPMNYRQVSRIELSPELVDCIVFWTKNPEPMLERLGELAPYEYYFQFTLTGYGADVEPNLPNKREKMIPVFLRLAALTGSERVVWRYDPIFFSETYTMDYHIKAFEQIAESLKGSTQRCVISFMDIYAKNKKSMELLGAVNLSGEELLDFAGQLGGIARKNGMEIAACAERLDLTGCGIIRSSCIDKALVERLLGCKLKAEKDKNQRPECGCMESVEVGTYHTCSNGCKYCYANQSSERVKENIKNYDVNSPLLCGTLEKEDHVTERKINSLKREFLQNSLW